MKKYLLYIGLCLLIYAGYHKYLEYSIKPSMPSIIVPNILLPDLKTNIYYDEYEKCKQLAKDYNRKIILIFGANWCPYCKDLKRDINNITEFNRYIVCFIDTDKNKNLVDKYRIRGLPTSIIIDYEDNETDRKSGYKKNTYIEWLKNSKHVEAVTWIKLLN